MAKEDKFVAKGEIMEALGNAMFRVKLEELNKVVISQASGKIRINRIRLVAGDFVEVEFSVYDLEKGRITRRL